MSNEIKLNKMQDIKDIGEISNYYGGLQVATLNGKYYFGIEGVSTVREWEEISKELYEALKTHKSGDIIESLQREDRD